MPCLNQQITSLSEAEIGRFQEGFLAYQGLCFLSNPKYPGSRNVPQYVGNVDYLHVMFLGMLSLLEVERVVSIHDYFVNTWRETFCTLRARTIGAGSCGVCGTLASCNIIQSSLGMEYSSARVGIINHLAHQGIPGLERALEHDGRVKFHDFIVSLLPVGGLGSPLIPGPPYMSRVNVAISSYYAHCFFQNPKLGRGEEESQNAGISKVWKEVEEAPTQFPNSWYRWYPRDSNEIITEGWSLWDLRASGWVFLDAETFELIQHYRRRGRAGV